METSLKSKVTEIFTKYNFSKDDASFISDVLGEIDERQDEKFQVSKELFLTQKDKVELIEKIGDVEVRLTEKIRDVEVRLTERIQDVEVRLTEKILDAEVRLTDKMREMEVNLTGKITSLYKLIYIVGLIQFLAIIGSILAILNFMSGVR